MPKAKKPAPAQFRLDRIVTEQFSVIEKSYTEGKEVRLESKVRLAYNDEEEGLLVGAEVFFEQNENPFLHLDVACVFLFEAESWKALYKADTKTCTVPRELALHLATITVGTARGVLHAKTEQTPFHRFVLPTINLFETIPGDVVMKEPEEGAPK